MKKQLLINILNDLKINPFLTERELSYKYFCHERTIRRYIKKLKDNNLLEIKNVGIRKKWIVKD